MRSSLPGLGSGKERAKHRETNDSADTQEPALPSLVQTLLLAAFVGQQSEFGFADLGLSLSMIVGCHHVVTLVFFIGRYFADLFPLHGRIPSRQTAPRLRSLIHTAVSWQMKQVALEIVHEVGGKPIKKLWV